MVRSLFERLKEVPDPRCGRKKKHDCAEMLVCVVLAYLCGRTALRRAVSWAVANEGMLREHMDLRGGVASVATLSRLLSGIDEEVFALTFSDWASQLLDGRGVHIIIDGKALRASASKVAGGNAPYLLNAIEAVTGIVLAQFQIGEKANEITAIPQLLERLDIGGNTLTIDAIGTQTAIMERIESGNAGFVFQVKKNQPQMYEDITGFVRTLETERAKADECPGYRSAFEDELKDYDCYRTDERNRERYEHREYHCSHSVDCLTNREKMPYIKTVGVSRQVRRLVVKDGAGCDVTPGLKTFLARGSTKQPVVKTGDGISDAVQETGVISNRLMTAKEIGEFRRTHWRIENTLHHVLDDAFREDRSPARGSRNNLALIRKIAYNIIRYVLARVADGTSVIGMMDWFSDNPSEAAGYIFNPLERLT